MKRVDYTGRIFGQLKVLSREDRRIGNRDVAFLLSVIYGHLMSHRPDAQEEYLDGGNPIFYYGPGDEE